MRQLLLPLALTLVACTSLDGLGDAKSTASGTLGSGARVGIEPASGVPWSMSVEGDDLVLRYGEWSATVARAVVAGPVEYARLDGAQPRYAFALADGRRASWQADELTVEGGGVPVEAAGPPGAETPQPETPIGVAVRVELAGPALLLAPDPDALAAWYGELGIELPTVVRLATDDLDAGVARLVGAGAVVRARSPREGRALLEDPAGNLIELAED